MVETAGSRVTQEEAERYQPVVSEDVLAMRQHLGMLEDEIRALKARVLHLEQTVGVAPHTEGGL